MKRLLNKRVMIIIIIVLVAFVAFFVFASLRGKTSSETAEVEETVEEIEEVEATNMLSSTESFTEYMEEQGFFVFDRTSEMTQNTDTADILFAYTSDEINDNDPCIIELAVFDDEDMSDSFFQSVEENLIQKDSSMSYKDGTTPIETYQSGKSQSKYFACSKNNNAVLYAVSDLDYESTVDDIFDGLGYMGIKETEEITETEEIIETEETDVSSVSPTEQVINTSPGVALDSGEFTEIMESMGYSVEDTTEEDSFSSQCKTILTATHPDIGSELVYFYRFNDIASAQDFVSSADDDSEQNTYKKIYNDSNDVEKCGIVSRIDSTVVFALTNAEREDVIDDVVKCLGYDEASLFDFNGTDENNSEIEENIEEDIASSEEEDIINSEEEELSENSESEIDEENIEENIDTISEEEQINNDIIEDTKEQDIDEDNTDENGTDIISDESNEEESNEENEEIEYDDTLWVDLNNMHFYIGEEKFTLGKSTPQDLIDSGIIFTEESTQMLETNLDPGVSVNLTPEAETSLRVHVTNNTEELKKCNECVITYIYINATEEITVSMSFPLDVAEDEFIATAGGTALKETIGETTLYIFAKDSNIAVFSFNNGVLDHFKMNYTDEEIDKITEKKEEEQSQQADEQADAEAQDTVESSAEDTENNGGASSEPVPVESADGPGE